MNIVAWNTLRFFSPERRRFLLEITVYNCHTMSSKDSILYKQIDEYQIVKLLGRGGMARVYQAVDVRLKRKVAIKVIDKIHRANSDYINRFKQEAQAIARLEHPYVVRLYRYGELDDLVYMAMQYIDGLDLAALLQTYKTDGAYIELEEVVRLIREICQGLDYAHSQGVIHRDVKPSNIMIDREGHAILTDFGLAMLAEVTTQGNVLGSPHYLSPEQAISSAKVVSQSDLYSVGVILYEMLTGEVPFDAKEPLAIAQMHIKDPVPLPSGVRPDLSRDLERVILKCLDKNPAHRYRTGAELASALEKAITGVGSDTEKSRPVRMTIPERVNLQAALAALPPAPTNAVSSSPHPKENAGTSAPEKDRTTSRLFPVAMGTSAILLALFLCMGLIAGSVWVAGQIGNGPSTPLPSQVPSTSRPTRPPSPTPVPPLGKATAPQTLPTDAPATSTVPANGSAPISTSFNLVIATEKDDSMVIFNVGTTAMFLPPLSLRQGEKTIVGNVWGVEILQPGECVIAMKDSGNPKLPAIECTEVGERQYFKPGERLWDKGFDVYYGSTQVDECSKNDDMCDVIFGDDE